MSNEKRGSIMAEFLFNLIIQPLIYIYELVFKMSYNILTLRKVIPDEYFCCIFIVSIVVNILTLPLYDSANRLQNEENKKQKSMSYWVNHIKKTFSGDERFLMLQAYYKQQNYRPFYSIRASLSLLLQIPFFTAAYVFFSNCKELNGVSITILPFIKNLMKPDNAFAIGGFCINILPIIMTVINLISSHIYTKDLALKDKIQPIILALIFLVLLYNSPSALVIYWTFNNIFSLVKIIFYRIIFKKEEKSSELIIESEDKKVNKSIIVKFVLSLVIFFAIEGILIPLHIIAPSPDEFFVGNFTPYDILYFVINITLGFALWIGLLFAIGNNKFKTALSNGLILVVIYILLNHFIFCNNLGTLNQLLSYEAGFKKFKTSEYILDLVIISILLIIFFIIYKKEKIQKFFEKKVKIKRQLSNGSFQIYILSVLLFGVIGISVLNIVKMNSNIKNYYILKEQNEKELEAQKNDNYFTMSKRGKNVIVLMLDRSIGSYFEYVLGERPELVEKFDGFIFYKNSLSPGEESTICGSPSLFGGYDYLPQNSNERKDVLLYDKQQEALSIMPYNFLKEGYNVAVSDLPFTNTAFKENKIELVNKVKELKLLQKANNSFYDNMSNICITMQKRNFIFYNIMKSSPVVLKRLIYHNGDYLNSGALFYNNSFLTPYYSLHTLNDNTKIQNDASNNCLIFCNDIIHDTTTVLPYGIYEPVDNIDVNSLKYGTIKNSDGKEFKGSYQHIGIEICAFTEIGKYLDYLKNNNIYDNTRIIICSDHGYSYNTSIDKDNEVISKNKNGNSMEFCINWANCSFLYKDFNRRGKLEFSDELMLNADVPYLAMENLIQKPINPYLNTIIEKKDRHQKVPLRVYVAHKGWHSESYNNEKEFKIAVAEFNGNDIFDKSAWDLNVNNE